MPLRSSEVRAISKRLLADYDAVNPENIFSEGFRVNLDDAWRIQAAVAEMREARGERVIGYKVGAVVPGNQQLMGLPHPVWGRLWDSELYCSGVTLDRKKYNNLSIEAEFGALLSGDIRPGASIEKIAASVEAIYPTLELHNLAMQSEKPHGPELVATNCINCGVVRGQPVTDLAAGRETDLKLFYDGMVVDEWAALSWPADILGAIVWLSRLLAEQHISLRGGDFILTSAWGPPIPVGAHTQVEVTSSEFGSVQATID
ncbi:hypothetical protein AB833_11950 [Chromatiales bacterium (ex Bugula neritina AB1)]|nr:hypothetical protein AB833_11950 [Chromatiales bacterium (ex Bugula neritina AB1)]